MPPAFTADPMPLRTDDRGVVRVAGTRVTLMTVLQSYLLGQTPEQIVDSYPVLPLAAVYAIVAHYLNHRSELDEYLRRESEAAEIIRRQIEAEPGHAQMRERLLARRATLAATVPGRVTA